MAIHLWGTDFRRSTSELRSKLFVPLENRKQFTEHLLSLGFNDLVYLHTCNRVEFYTTADNHFSDTQDLWLKLFESLGISEDTYYQGYHCEGKGALRHLLRVACSLESLVVGEPQILGQLKDAFQWTREEDLPIQCCLHKGLQLAFQTAKAVRSETSISQKPVSVATLCFQRVREMENGHPVTSSVIVGRSPICLRILRWLRAHRPQSEVLWVNRSLEKIECLPEAQCVPTAPLSDFLNSPPAFSHLFTATSGSEPLFGERFFGKLDSSSRVFFDFAQPPDVDGGRIPASIKLVQLDCLAKEAAANRTARLKAIEEANPIIERALREYYLGEKETPLLKNFSEVECKVVGELEEALSAIESTLPGESHPRVRKWARNLVKRNMYQAREHLRGILRQAAQSQDIQPRTP